MIREALEKDAESIVSINIKSWKDTYKDIFPQTFLDNLDPRDANTIENCKKKIGQYIVYEVDNKVVGFARYGLNKKQYSDEYGEIYALYLDENYKGMGIGSSLVKYILKKLKGTYKYVLISTLVENSANTFYKKIGGKYIATSVFELDGRKYLENVYEYIL